MTFARGSVDPFVVKIQRALNEIVGMQMVADGQFGGVTESGMKEFQRLHQLDQTGKYDSATEAILGVYIDKRFLDESDFVDAAKKLDVVVAKVKAIQEVESKGAGFFYTGQTVILYERHIFRRQIKAWLDTSGAVALKTLADKLDVVPTRQFVELALEQRHGDIYGPAGGYKGGVAEYVRLEKAVALDAECAYKSASWGLFQIMGFHHKLIGFATAADMVKSYAESERNQILSFCDFMLADKGLINSFRKGDWADVAKRYNGENYAINKYDVKLAAAFKKWST